MDWLKKLTGKKEPEPPQPASKPPARPSQAPSKPKSKSEEPKANDFSKLAAPLYPA